MHFLQHRIGENSKLFHVISSFCWGLYYYFAPHLKPHPKKNMSKISKVKTPRCHPCIPLDLLNPANSSSLVGGGKYRQKNPSLSVPMVFVVFNLGILGDEKTHKYPIYRAQQELATHEVDQQHKEKGILNPQIRGVCPFDSSACIPPAVLRMNIHRFMIVWQTIDIGEKRERKILPMILSTSSMTIYTRP